MSDTRHNGQLRAVFYGRMSTDGQEASIPEQREWARRTAAAIAVDLVAEFQDDGIPGSEVTNRPGLMTMLAFCQQPPGGRPINALLLWDGDRFSRADSFRTGAVLNQLMDTGLTRLITPEGTIDLTSETDRVMFMMRQELGRAAFSRSLSKNVTRSALRRAMEGQWVAGKPPYGYRKGADHHLILGPAAEVEAVRWMFGRYADSNDSLGDLARRLSEMGCPPPHGGLAKGRWTRETVLRILHKRAYVGDIAWNEKHKGKYSRVEGGEVRPATERRKQRLMQNDPADLVLCENAHPAIIDRDTFGRVQRKLEGNRWKRTTPIPGGGVWVLSGLLRCGDCGGIMYGHKEEHKRRDQVYVYRRYFCGSNIRHGKGTCRNNSVPQEWMLQAIAAVVREWFTDPARVGVIAAKMEAAARQEARETEAKVRTLEDRLAKLDADILLGSSNLLLISPDLRPGAEVHLRKWQEQRAQMAQERDRAAQAIAEDAVAAAKVVGAMQRLQELQERITTAPPQVVRDILPVLVKSVTVRFDHSRPHNQTHAAEIEIETTPEAANLLPPVSMTQHVSVTINSTLPPPPRYAQNQ